MCVLRNPAIINVFRLVTQVDSNFIKEFLQYHLLDTVNVKVT